MSTKKQKFIGPRNQRTFIGPLNIKKPKVKKLKKAIKNVVKRQLKTVTRRGRGGVSRVRGRGDYTVDNMYSDVGGALIKPFFDETASSGIVNKGARYLGMP